jgi:hypothetical protein
MPLKNYKGRYKGLYMVIITIPNIIKTIGLEKSPTLVSSKILMQYSMHLPAQQKAKMNQIVGSAYKAPFQNKKAAGTALQWCESASPSANCMNLNCCMS